MQPAIKAEPGTKAEGDSNAVSSVLPQNVSVGVKEEPAGALPMEVDDDAMFQQKPSKAVKPETSEVGHSTSYWSPPCFMYNGSSQRDSEDNSEACLTGSLFCIILLPSSCMGCTLAMPYGNVVTIVVLLAGLA